MNVDTVLLAEISQNIKDLQLQLDYERSRITDSLGGEPVLYDVLGTGKITGSAASIGGGIDITGAILQVDGEIITGDNAGGVGGKVKSGAFITGTIDISLNGVTTINLAINAGIIVFLCRTGGGNFSGVFNYYLSGGSVDVLVSQPGCSTVKNTADKLNIYVENGVLKLQNLIGQLYLSYTLIGVSS